ncbi:peptidoglycan DD-metalloendopeptidase family protein [Streptomyces sp. NPDC002564]|uniref:peptidoglycan DD-metalloendopeptidase family protein n=1 Tax=Streptomyces sp. NPDC002564 TaxID=3364649 RepID=UPI0036CD5A08
MRLDLLLPLLAALLTTAPPPPATTPSAAFWPVGTRPEVIRAWTPPPTPYAAGHRGVDLAAPPGSPVRAVAAGRIAFAGPVAGRGVVVVELDGTGDPPLRTTYEPVRAPRSLAKGDRVAAGDPVGTLEFPAGHCPDSCLHWGLLRAGTYLDPLSLLPPWLLHRGPSRLLPARTATDSDTSASVTATATEIEGTADGRELSPVRPAAPWPRPPR